MANSDNRLAELFFEHRGKTIDKWEQYLAIYARELAPFLAANQPIRLLEIGVQNGGSLELWSKYLPAGSEIVGIDIDPKVGSLTFEGSIRAYVGDGTDRAQVAKLLGSAMFDVIIDDGSHTSSDIVAAFRSLFDRLAFGGKFIVEDLHASYWPSFGGGLRVGSAAIEYLKGLVDALNADHLAQAVPLSDDDMAELRRFAPSLARVAFYDSVAVIEKLATEKTAPYRRMLSGVAADVVDPFAGVIAMPVAAIAPLLFGDGQKRHIETRILEQLEEERGRNPVFNGEMARAAAESARLNVKLLELRAQQQQERAEFHQLRAQQQQERAEFQLNLAQLAQLEARLQGVYASSSWRVTRPLRAGARLVRRAARAMRSPRPTTEATRADTDNEPERAKAISPCGSESWEKSAIRATKLFDYPWYLNTYKDVAEAKLDPLDHYLSSGAFEGRNPNPLFDTIWYLKENPDVADEGLNPLAHYASSGATEGRDPHPDFSTCWYVEQNPHVTEAGINPLSHYLHEGKARGLLPFSPDRRYRLHTNQIRLRDALDRPELIRHMDVMTWRPHFIIWIEGEDEADRTVSLESCRAQLYLDWQIALSIQDAVQLNGISDPTSVYLIWIAAGDRLSDKALYACAAALNADPAADLIYFDEDEWHPDGRRLPFYKPAWSPDYLEAMNYIGPAACFRLSRAIDLLPVVDSLYDFTLRFVERATRIRHVRQVLWHRKTGPSCTVTAAQTEADLRAISGRLLRTGRDGRAVPNIVGFGSYDVQVTLKSEPLVSIIIPTAGKIVMQEGRQIDLVANCINTILARSTYRNLEFVIIDNGDFDVARLTHIDPARFKLTSFLEPEFNVAKKLNLGATLASGSIFLLLNDDVEPLVDNWIERMLEHFEKPHVGVVGAKLLYPDLTTQHVGVVLNANNADHVRRSVSRADTGYFFSTCGVRNYQAVTGAVMMTPAARFREVGGYTESLAVSYNDVDYCLKLAERGFTTVYAPKAELIHFESQSRKASLDLSESAYFHRRWANLTTDPFYNEDTLSVAPPTFEVQFNDRLI
jgi:GT2 family glycosyltransferase/SAM-dependent methyltransferase